MILYITALSIGLLGSFHCVGMCGPISLVIPMKDRKPLTLVAGMTLYNLGRMTTYMALGGIIGTLGGGLHLPEAQRYLSILTGVMMILMIALPKGNLNWLERIPLLYKLNAKVKAMFAKQLSGTGWKAQYGIGLANGLLPCGLVYIAMTGALAAGEWHIGALYMMFFSIGTWPMLFFTGIAGKLVSLQFRQRLVKAIPALVLVIGMMFILRGMNLGIPYLSPKISTESSGQQVICH
ncbi:sulfite exporter TauE/SafE family protein [Aureibacter tunicatorum]|uniref:Urease accessory protein UreH-like transmembrane domain-containing protein n=1 Tax=Aureibacter tunicatorum TaxID=866807 RepID=A0AAE3XJ18_9BACT|nr:sulfite exporter TauE/SafE family protein [Aureibacter tunicatorum]MDR6237320.1 hypothetical protein [Aureibacter tunicatorum]BDD06311.1 membrane protein [Aureibacter tunicatorum]